MGTQVVVPYRDEDDKRHLKLMGDLGQVVPMVRNAPSTLYSFPLLTGREWQEWDVRNETQIAECLRHSDIVFNLVGRDYETKCVVHECF